MNDKAQTHLLLYTPFVTNGTISIESIGTLFLDSKNAQVFARQEIKERGLPESYYAGHMSHIIEVPAHLQNQPKEELINRLRILVSGDDISFRNGSVLSIDFEDAVADDFEALIDNYEKAGFISEKVADKVYKLTEPKCGECVCFGIDTPNVIDLYAGLEKEDRYER